MKSNIEKNLNELKEVDVYSLILFALFKLKEIPEYSTLSELVYLLNKDSLLNLLEYFGGLTIKIPTTKELKLIVHSLLLYQYVNLENIPFDEALKKLGKDDFRLNEIKDVYFKLCDILNKYEFKRR